MNLKKLFSLTLIAFAIALSGTQFQSCGLIDEGLDPCTTTYRVRFNFDYNMLYADAFSSQVPSVSLWAFDSSTGAPVWHGEASGEALTKPGFAMEVPLPPGGTYDFLAWGGLAGQNDFTVNSNPASINELGSSLRLTPVTRATDGSDGSTLYTDSELPRLFYGRMMGVRLDTPQGTDVNQDVTIDLMRDTHCIQIALQHMDGAEIDPDDFDFSITYDNSELSWENTLLSGPTFQYRPWSVIYANIDLPVDGAVSTVRGTILAELSTSRLFTTTKPILRIYRRWDQRDVVRIPLISYLLAIKGNYNRHMSDQEFLDRQDQFTLHFFIDKNSNWYMAAGIVINGWTVVPIQDAEM